MHVDPTGTLFGANTRSGTLGGVFRHDSSVYEYDLQSCNDAAGYRNSYDHTYIFIHTYSHGYLFNGAMLNEVYNFK